ncbi:FIST N-terminal domain-containing protein [Aestuariibius sp. 2305UL40-4]|uniref:FIST N-terminal domain-containing protein n=1 Tax=Aestuariibius violaceus TaxID=3234132 RepID=UPI00345F0010
MDGRDILASEDTSDRAAPLCHAETGIDTPDPLSDIASGLGSGPFALIVLFISPDAPFDRLAAEATRYWPDTPVAACTTAGELGASGYADGQIIATGFPAEIFSTACIAIRDLTRLDESALIDRVIAEQVTLAQASPDMERSFAFLMVDGLSTREDALVAALSPALAATPLFGGSAGDGTAFGRTRIALDGAAFSDGAALCLIRTSCDLEVFSIDHLRPTDQRMVVTEADPVRRLVKTINAEPAAREYARITGLDPDDLGPFAFAAHPVVVRIGGSHHVRAIQRVTDDGELIFFSAIDEGMVLSVAEPDDIATHLDRALRRLSQPGQPASILACDCLLRRMEAEQRQSKRDISRLLARHGVRGFSTYGEQIGPLHINHTMTGVALYPPPKGGT